MCFSYLFYLYHGFCFFTPKNVGKIGLWFCIDELWGIFSHDIFSMMMLIRQAMMNAKSENPLKRAKKIS
jgi:hypothetical protein